MRTPRTALHRLYAIARGYFWLRCSVCGREYGGHEVAHLPDSGLLNTVVCNRCGPAVRAARLVLETERLLRTRCFSEGHAIPIKPPDILRDTPLARRLDDWRREECRRLNSMVSAADRGAP